MKISKNWLKYICYFIIGFLVYTMLASIAQVDMLKELKMEIDTKTIVLHTMQSGIVLYTIIYFLILTLNMLYNVRLIKKLNKQSEKIRKVGKEKILKERGEINMKKKILLIVLAIVLVALIIVSLNIARKVSIISDFSRNIEKYQKLTNFYSKEIYRINNGEIRTNEKWCKDDISILKNTFDDGSTRTLYYNKEETLMLTDKPDNTKVGVRAKRNSNDIYAGIVIEDASFYIEDDLWKEIAAAFTTKITSENVNGKECYKFCISDNWQFYVDKESMLKVKEINGSINRELVDYRIGNVTDKEVQMPNLEEYTINEKRE